MYYNFEKLLYRFCDFTLQFRDCNFTLHFGNKIALKNCKITNVLKSKVTVANQFIMTACNINRN